MLVKNLQHLDAGVNTEYTILKSVKLGKVAMSAGFRTMRPPVG